MSGSSPETDLPEPAERLAGALAAAGGGAVRAVLLYGSQLHRTRRDVHSAYDFVVLVDDYRAFYARLRAAGELPRPVWLMRAMAHVLPPNVIAFAPGKGREGIAKSLIVSRAHFERALGPRPPDHFLLARMVQRVGTVWSAAPADAAWVAARLAGARSRVLDWMAPYLEGTFDAARLGRRLLEVCYRGELRPEAQDRADTVFEAQVEHFRATFPAVLEQAAREGVLERVDGSEQAGPHGRPHGQPHGPPTGPPTGQPKGPPHEPPQGPPKGPPTGAAETEYRLARPASASVRKRWRRHFARSKARTTARWLKHTVTFANWLPYIVRKVERHTGREIHLTSLERKLPLVFLWPRAIHVLLTRPRGDAAERERGERKREAES